MPWFVMFPVRVVVGSGSEAVGCIATVCAAADNIASEGRLSLQVDLSSAAAMFLQGARSHHDVVAANGARVLADEGPAIYRDRTVIGHRARVFEGDAAVDHEFGSGTHSYLVPGSRFIA